MVLEKGKPSQVAVLEQEPEDDGLKTETSGNGNGSGRNIEEDSLNPEDEQARVAAEQFIKFWTTSVPEDVILETPAWIRDMALSRSLDSFRYLLNYLHLEHDDFPEWYINQREAFYSLFSTTPLTPEARNFVQRVYDGCLIVGDTPPAVYVPVASFGIDLSRGIFGPFEYLRAMPVNRVGIEQNLLADHQVLLDNELPPAWFDHQAEENYHKDWQAILTRV